MAIEITPELLEKALHEPLHKFLREVEETKRDVAAGRLSLQDALEVHRYLLEDFFGIAANRINTELA
jgi:hypothetical protein